MQEIKEIGDPVDWLDNISSSRMITVMWGVHPGQLLQRDGPYRVERVIDHAADSPRRVELHLKYLPPQGSVDESSLTYRWTLAPEQGWSSVAFTSERTSNAATSNADPRLIERTEQRWTWAERDGTWRVASLDYEAQDGLGRLLSRTTSEYDYSPLPSSEVPWRLDDLPTVTEAQLRYQRSWLEVVLSSGFADLGHHFMVERVAIPRAWRGM